MKCQVEACPTEASDVLTYKREGEVKAGIATSFPVVFEAAFCPPHASGLRALASMFANDPQAQPKIAVACGSKGCMEVATERLTDITGTPVGFYCAVHAVEALAALNGSGCSLEGCKKPGRLVIESPLGTEGIYGCEDHAKLFEDAAVKAGVREVKPAEKRDGKCLTSGCEREATVHTATSAFAMWCQPCADDIQAHHEEQAKRREGRTDEPTVP